jgi:signal transduction histidine kinase
VLNIEDSDDDSALLLRALRQGGYQPTVERVDTPDALLAALDRQEWDVIVSDFAMPQFDAFSALELVQDRGLDLPFIIFSGTIGEETAVAAMRAGAHDYIMKDNLPRLLPAIERELREAEARRQRRDLEMQLLQAQKLESIGRLAGGIAHDFNNLLTAILGYSELAEAELPADSSVRECLQNVQDAAHRAASLTHQLLAFARKQVIKPSIVDLNGLLRDTEKMLRRLIGADVELVSLPDPDLGSVRVDAGQFGQVLLNLALNARDAMPNGGTLTFETANLSLGEDFARQHFDVAPGEYVLLTVTDSGVGMDRQTQARVFEPFFTTKDPGKGTGLGLSTCYGIVKQSGGEISLQSKPGRGTTFKIYLPRIRETAEAASTADHVETPRGKATVLLVEDEERVRSVAARTLDGHGYRVLEASNGIEARRIVEELGAQIDLIITDLVMPLMGGAELIRWVGDAYPGIRTLLMSGYVEAAGSQPGTTDPATAFLQKPFTTRELLQMVQEVLSDAG